MEGAEASFLFLLLPITNLHTLSYFSHIPLDDNQLNHIYVTRLIGIEI